MENVPKELTEKSSTTKMRDNYTVGEPVLKMISHVFRHKQNVNVY